MNALDGQCNHGWRWLGFLCSNQMVRMALVSCFFMVSLTSVPMDQCCDDTILYSMLIPKNYMWSNIRAFHLSTDRIFLFLYLLLNYHLENKG